jgi:glycosyltransferase involved in cell wall biosynthesis
MGTNLHRRRRRDADHAGRVTATGPRARRLLWVNHFAVTPDMGGGTRHAELSRELVGLGWRVTLAASDFHLHRREYMRRPRESERAAISERVDGVDWRWLYASPYSANDHRRVANWMTFGRSLLREELNGERPDVVIGSSPHLLAALAAQRIARRLDVPFVFEVRDLWPEMLQLASSRRGPGYWGMWAIARFLYRAADRVIVLARGTGEYLVASGVPVERIVFVPNGVDPSAFAGDGQPDRADGATLRLVYAGAHGPANGLDAVLDAAARLRDDPRVSFLLVGDGPSKPSLRERAAQAGLSNVEFRDSVSKAEMPALLATCDAGLMVLRDLPLFSFGVSPNKLFDYWGAALPVVCNVPGEVEGMVGQSGGGVQATDTTGTALAEAIRALLDLPLAERRAMGASGSAWVCREHDRRQLAVRLDRELRSLISAPA